jgi:hypothetical protein
MTSRHTSQIDPPVAPETAAPIADRGNIRLYFRRGDTDDYRYIAWFRSKGYDLYWGAGERTREMPPQTVSGTQHQFAVPDDLMSLPEVEAKSSYHESGLIHRQAGGSGIAAQADEFHGHPEQLSQMKLLNAVFTAAPANLPSYKRSLHRKRSYAMVFQLAEEQWTRRQYFEFYLSPPGPVDWPEPLYLKATEPDELHSHWFDIERRRVLAVRWHTITDETLTQWQPKASLWIFPVGEPNAGGGMANVTIIERLG